MKSSKIKNFRPKVVSRLSVTIIAALMLVFLFSLFSSVASAQTSPTTTTTTPSSGITITPLHKVLVENDSNIKKVWTEVRNGVNYLVIAALIFVSFANILRIDLNNYAIKKILPALIMGVILANFSYFICRMLVDFSNVMMSLLMDGVKNSGNDPSAVGTGVAGAFNFTDSDSFPVDPNNLNRSLVFIVGEFAGAVAVLILAFMFFIRNYVIYFLVGLAPLAFMATTLPQAKNLFNQWWKMLLQWTFLPIISLFWLWIGGMWYGSGFTGTSNISSLRTTDFNSAIFALAFALVCYYLAITTPIKAGGAIMGKWADIGKKAWGATGGNAWKYTGGEAINRVKTQASQGIKEWYQKQGAEGGKYNIVGSFARMGQRYRNGLQDSITRTSGHLEGIDRRLGVNLSEEEIKKASEISGEIDKLRRKADKYKAYIGKESTSPENKAKAEERLSQTESDLKRKEKERSKIIRLNRYQRGRMAAIRAGGDREMAQEELTSAYLMTDAGEKWDEARRKWLARKELMSNLTEIRRTKTETDFVDGAGIWADIASPQGQLRQLMQKSQTDLNVIAKSLLQKKTEDRRMEVGATMYTEMKLNEDLLRFRNYYEEREALREEMERAADEKEREIIEDKLQKLKKSMSKTTGVAEEHVDMRADRVETDIQERIDSLSTDDRIKKDKDGKLIVPYEMSYAVQLSDDGKSIVGLNGFAEGTGDPSGSRSKREYGAVVAEETASLLKKFSLQEIIEQVKNGTNDYKAEDIIAVLQGRIEDASSPVAAAYAEAAIDAVMRSYQKAQRGTQDYDDALDALSGFLDVMGEERTQSIVTDIQDRLVENTLAKNYRQLENVEGLESHEAKEEFVRNQLRDQGMFMGGMPGEDGSNETASDYFDRISKISGGKLDAKKCKIKQEGVDSAGVALPSKDGEISLSIAPGEVRRMAVGALGNDEFLGWNKPTSERVGAGRSTTHHSEVEAEIAKAAEVLEESLMSARAMSIEDLAAEVKEAGRDFSDGSRAIFSQAYLRIGDRQKKLLENFARQIGYLVDKVELDERDHLLLMQVLKDSPGKRRQELEAEIAVIAGKDKKGEDIKIHIPDNFSLSPDARRPKNS